MRPRFFRPAGLISPEQIAVHSIFNTLYLQRCLPDLCRSLQPYFAPRFVTDLRHSSHGPAGTVSVPTSGKSRKTLIGKGKKKKGIQIKVRLLKNASCLAVTPQTSSYKWKCQRDTLPTPPLAVLDSNQNGIHGQNPLIRGVTKSKRGKPSVRKIQCLSALLLFFFFCLCFILSC